VYFLADAFLLDQLKTAALRKFVDLLAKLWLSESLVECVVEVFRNTIKGDGMRTAVVRIVIEHRHELLSNPAFEHLISEGGDFAVEITGALVQTTAPMSF
jgi:hypothetical protein